MKLLRILLAFVAMLFINGCAPKTPYIVEEKPAEEVRIAMILPYKLIGRYSHSTTTAVFTYFLTRGEPFVVKSFRIEEESPDEIERALRAIKDEGFRYVIAPLTPEGAGIVADSEEELIVFFPTVHKNDLRTASGNVYFGAIDYRDQIDALMPLASSPLVVMYDTSAQGRKLLAMTEASYSESGESFRPTGRRNYSLQTGVPYLPELEPTKKEVIAYGVDQRTRNLGARLGSNEKIQFGSFFLNTPVISSTMILSQLSYYDTNVTNVLSTQINYDPLILSMTQKREREYLYIANSISIRSDSLSETNAVLSNDIVYDWINYASTVGADFFSYLITGSERILELPIIDNQVVYPVSIVRPYGSRFKAIRSE
jgi:hypothetical protein